LRFFPPFTPCCALRVGFFLVFTFLGIYPFSSSNCQGPLPFLICKFVVRASFCHCRRSRFFRHSVSAHFPPVLSLVLWKKPPFDRLRANTPLTNNAFGASDVLCDFFFVVTPPVYPWFQNVFFSLYSTRNAFRWFFCHVTLTGLVPLSPSPFPLEAPRLYPLCLFPLEEVFSFL